MRRKIIGTMALLSIFALFIVAFTACDSKKKTYDDSIEMFNNGNYSDALSQFETLGDYENSQEMVSACKYEIATEFFTSEQYEEALTLFSELGDYKDSLDTANACRYTIAAGLFEDEEYEDALAIYTELADYKDSEEKANACAREIGMRTNADYDFLSALETSILDRLGRSNNDNADHLSLVNTELAYLSRFESESFYDANLKALSDQYLDGLYLQKEALAEEYEGDYQIEWQEGMVERFKVLKLLYEQYDFLTDNTDFIVSYIMAYDDAKALLNAYDEITEDLIEQFNNETLASSDGYMYSLSLKNDTEYTYSVVFDFSFYDGNDVLFDSNSAFVENVHPGESYIVSVYIDVSYLTTDYFNYASSWYYTDVIFN